MEEQLQLAMSRFQECIATRDRRLGESVLDQDYALMLVQPTQAVMSRERWLDLLPDYVVHSTVVNDMVVEVDGDLAVALHRDEMSATVRGEDRSGTFVITDIWRRRADGWKIWRRHSTPLTAGRLLAD